GGTNGDPGCVRRPSSSFRTERGAAAGENHTVVVHAGTDAASDRAAVFAGGKNNAGGHRPLADRGDRLAVGGAGTFTCRRNIRSSKRREELRNPLPAHGAGGSTHLGKTRDRASENRRQHRHRL